MCHTPSMCRTSYATPRISSDFCSYQRILRYDPILEKRKFRFWKKSFATLVTAMETFSTNDVSVKRFGNQACNSNMAEAMAMDDGGIFSYVGKFFGVDDENTILNSSDESSENMEIKTVQHLRRNSEKFNETPMNFSEI